jgi:hypothetical protein
MITAGSAIHKYSNVTYDRLYVAVLWHWFAFRRSGDRSPEPVVLTANFRVFSVWSIFVNVKDVMFSIERIVLLDFIHCNFIRFSIQPPKMPFHHHSNIFHTPMHSLRLNLSL